MNGAIHIIETLMKHCLILLIGYQYYKDLSRFNEDLYLYGLVLIFHWIGKVIHANREELGYHPDKSPEREAENEADETMFKRKKCLVRVYKERRRENVLPVLLTYIDIEEDKLAAHAWYHSEMKQWDNKMLMIKHGYYYIRALREAGKHIVADLIQQECQAIDPTFSCE